MKQSDHQVEKQCRKLTWTVMTINMKASFGLVQSAIDPNHQEGNHSLKNMIEFL